MWCTGVRDSGLTHPKAQGLSYLVTGYWYPSPCFVSCSPSFPVACGFFLPLPTVLTLVFEILLSQESLLSFSFAKMNEILFLRKNVVLRVG